jgi:hypothetical protein
MKGCDVRQKRLGCLLMAAVYQTTVLTTPLAFHAALLA